MKNFYSLIAILTLTFGAFAQKTTDSIHQLPTVVITAFEQNRQLLQVSATVNTISAKQLQQFNNTSIVPALNSLPGIRMEERSPGSYRMNIRGSSLRAPFGVRNVKVYINDIPFTDPGGNTYLNQFSFFNIQSMEILKGPAGSMYGSGNGGVLLLKSNSATSEQGAGIQLGFGSYGLQNYNGTIHLGNHKSQNNFTFSRLKSDGYRVQTKMKREVFTWDSKYQLSDKSKLNTLFLLGDLFYQTPGGLTEAEFLANPQQARPKVGALPGAEQANAAIYQQTFYAGISHQYRFAKQLQNTTSLYGAFSRIQNPSIRNYEKRTEPHVGARTSFVYTPDLPSGDLKIVAGAEVQNGWFTTNVYKTKNGQSDSLQTSDELSPENKTIFAQTEYALHGWILTAGASINANKIAITRLSVFPLTTKARTFKNEISPRLALLKQLNPNLSVYGSMAKGFSPPTVAEVLPSTSVISLTLNAENGWNYETGARWQAANNLYLDLNLFYYKLNNTIVQRKDGSGADYFVNAGSTKQKGIEFAANYHLKTANHALFNHPQFGFHYTFHDFKYLDFKQVANDFAGKRLPGVPQQTIHCNADVQIAKSFYTNFNFNYVSPIQLNDANTFRAAEYYLLSVRAGFKKKFAQKLLVDFFVSGDNLLNEQYSLGNDINAAGNRFYNAAAKRNFSIGISLFAFCKTKE